MLKSKTTRVHESSDRMATDGKKNKRKANKTAIYTRGRKDLETLEVMDWENRILGPGPNSGG